ncbi:chitooligosaccharide deacetylase [Acrasis kona]|uniref:Chitooligosaccharide deacetylase n=1 Tax=Acrasis kona TaxID=1008807 RepID=A0AAW2ZT07_9EUKA
MFVWLVAVCFIIAVLIYIQPTFVLDFLSRRDPEVIFRFKTEEKVVALTIDDGPSSLMTLRILGRLRDYGVKATFFLIGGQVPTNEDVLLRLRKGGHELGNHTMKNKTSLMLSSDELKEQIRNMDNILFPPEVNRPLIKWFRPGFGYYNKRMIRDVTECGMRLVLGDVYPHDYYLPFPYLNSLYILKSVRPGSVIILHDLPETLKTLDYILPALRSMGYKVTTLSNLAKISST